MAISHSRRRTPWHLWAVGIVSLLWNAYGAYDYTMSHTGDLEAFEAMGFDAAAYAWVKALPAWSVAAWAIGVWGSVLGSILLLLRSRHATTAFLVSAIGAAISFAYQFSTVRPPSLGGGASAAVPIAIMIAIVLQWYYARRMRVVGVLH